MENQPMLDLLWHICFRQQRWPDQVTADTTYGTIETIVPIEDAGIRAYLPLPDWDQRTSYFGASRFIYDPQTDSYRCPNGQTLRRETAKYTEGTIVYRTDRGVCAACPLKPQCTSSAEGRRIHRSMDEDYFDRVRAYHQTEPYQKALRKRQVWVDPIFAEANVWHGMRRFRYSRSCLGDTPLIRRAARKVDCLAGGNPVCLHRIPPGCIVFVTIPRGGMQRKLDATQENAHAELRICRES
jgi:hypothetical protein